MNSKQRTGILLILVCLTVTMLFFQNCSPSGALYSSDASVTDPLIIDPPIIFASKNSTCTQISTTFAANETVYICIRDAGTAPIYCSAYSTATTCNNSIVSTAAGWTSTGSGDWARGFMVNNGGAFPVGTFTAYVTHTNDPNAVSNTTFTVN